MAVCGPMLGLLVRMLADSAERCRELSVRIIAESLTRLPEPAVLLTAVMPTLALRLGSSPVLVSPSFYVSQGGSTLAHMMATRKGIAP